jgi:hypothetical protein
MRALMITIGTLIFAAGFVAGGRLQPPVGAQGFAVMECGVASAAQVRTTLYFGLARPKGSVTELEWQIFLRDEVTRRFPDGLTVWEAEGQWRTPAGSIDHEQSKVLLLVHPDTAAAIGPGRHRGVSQDVRAAIRSVGKRARVCCSVGSSERSATQERLQNLEKRRGTFDDR